MKNEDIARSAIANRHVRQLTNREVAQALRVPGRADNKYTRGVVQLNTGSQTYPGAAVLGTAGAIGAGPGMVRFAGAPTPTQLVLGRFPEVVPEAGRFEAAVIGSGWDPEQADQARKTLTSAGSSPVVVDAGAMEYVTGQMQKGAAGQTDLVSAPLVFTPHMGEAKKLWAVIGAGAPPADGHRLAHDLAKLTGAIVVLKTSTTWVASPDGTHSMFEAPSGWGATAGSGDILAGVIGGVLASTDFADTSVVDAVAAAVWIHGTAAARASGIWSKSGAVTANRGHPITAMDIAANVPLVIGSLLRLTARDFGRSR